LGTPLELLIWLIDERHVAHRVGFRFRVHRDPMPVTQGDGGMVWMTDAAPCKSAWRILRVMMLLI